MNGLKPVYNLSFYKGMLTDIKKAGYSFETFGRRPHEDRPNNLIIYLRHDIDLCPSMALAMGRAEAELGLSASYFFQIGTETYNIFSDTTRTAMRTLRQIGHLVGLHIDERQFDSDEPIISHTIAWFASCVTELDPIVSFHRPTEQVLRRSYGSFINTYEPSYFSNYVSDSGRNDSFYSKISSLINDGTTPIQFLIHPFWWMYSRSIEDIRDSIIENRSHAISNYFVNNFPKALKRTS